MPNPKPSATAKLGALAEEIERTGFANTTRLTVIKKWLQEPGRLHALAVLVAKRVLEKVSPPADDQAQELWDRSLRFFNNLDPFGDLFDAKDAEDLHKHLVEFQNEHRRGQWGGVRTIENMDLLTIEQAIDILLQPDRVDLGYRLVADLLATFEGSHGTGLYLENLDELRWLVGIMEDVEGQESGQ